MCMSIFCIMLRIVLVLKLHQNTCGAFQFWRSSLNGQPTLNGRTRVKLSASAKTNAFPKVANMFLDLISSKLFPHYTNGVYLF